MNKDDFAEKALEILKENKSNYTDDFKRMKDRGDRLGDYESEEDMREQLSRIFQEQGCIQDRERLLDIMYWKFKPNRYAANKKSLRKQNTDEDIRKVTARAFALDNCHDSLRALTELGGIGEAAASTILMFYKPDKYTILDQNAWKAAVELGMEAEKKEKDYTYQEYAQYNEFCHDILHNLNYSQEHQMLDLRQLDLVLHSLGADM